MFKNNWFVALLVVTCSCIISYFVIFNNIDYDKFENDELVNYIDKKVLADDTEIIISINNKFHYHNTSKRTEKIKYIVIHYTGVPTGSRNLVKHYNKLSSTEASADFFVDSYGDIVQYNSELEERYSWAVGGEMLENSNGGKLYGKVTNDNSISIEICVRNEGEKIANSPDWYFTDKALESARLLVKYLMNEYDISLKNVVRHYDVTGKLCPGVIGWNEDSGSVKKWKNFLLSLE